jgi:signal transduction histidine kinase
LARGLCPVELETNGLHAALQELASRVSRTNIDCTFEAPATTQVYDNAAAVHLYRIAQEAVNNAIKHGRAKKVQVGLNTQNGQTVLTVKDDGCGFPKTGPKATGMGLRVMNYRAGMIGAAITVENLPGGGALLKCIMPNRPPAGARESRGSSRRPGSRRPASRAAEPVEA